MKRSQWGKEWPVTCFANLTMTSSPKPEPSTVPYHVEHVLPKSVVNTLLKDKPLTRRNVKKWIIDIGEPLPETTEEKRTLGESLQTLLSMLGNQALLYHKANGIATDAPFEDKREFYRGQASELTKTLAENSVWGPKEIIARQKMLAERAPEVWRK